MREVTELSGEEIVLTIGPGYGCVRFDVETWDCSKLPEREHRYIEVDLDDVERVVNRLRRAKNAGAKMERERLKEAEI